MGSCEYVNEPSGSIKCGEFLGKLKKYSLPNKASASWSLIAFIMLGAAITIGLNKFIT
jgi:hypothetical protein